MNGDANIENPVEAADSLTPVVEYLKQRPGKLFSASKLCEKLECRDILEEGAQIRMEQLGVLCVPYVSDGTRTMLFSWGMPDIDGKEARAYLNNMGIKKSEMSRPSFSRAIGNHVQAVRRGCMNPSLEGNIWSDRREYMFAAAFSAVCERLRDVVRSGDQEDDAIAVFRKKGWCFSNVERALLLRYIGRLLESLDQKPENQKNPFFYSNAKSMFYVIIQTQ